MSFYEKRAALVSASFREDSVRSSIRLNVVDDGIRSSIRVSVHTPITIVPAPHVSEKKSRNQMISFAIIYTMIFFNGCCFTAVVPSVPFYLQILNAPPEFLGWVVSFYSLGQIFGSPMAGFLADLFPARRLLTISSSLGLISSLVYAVAPGYNYILFSRLITGISAGMEFTTELAFIARNTTNKERTTYLASVTACNVVGFIMGPALGTILAVLDISFLGLKIDQYTGPGWLLAFMFMLDVIMIQCFFKDNCGADSDSVSDDSDDDSEERVELLGDKEQSNASYGGVLEDHPEEESDDEDDSADLPEPWDLVEEGGGSAVTKAPPPSVAMVLSLIFVQFTVMCGFSLTETITSPLTQDELGWSVQDCNLLFTCGGFVSLIAYVVFVVASRWVEDRWLILYALVLCFMGFVLAVDWKQLSWVPIWVTEHQPSYMVRFVSGFMVMNAGFMTGRPVTFALYSKLIAPEYQGKYLGWMVAGGSAARTLGPFFAVYLYYGVKTVGYNLLALFGSVGVFHLACVVLVIWQWARLLPGVSDAKSANTSTSTSEPE